MTSSAEVQTMIELMILNAPVPTAQSVLNQNMQTSRGKGLLLVLF